MEAINPQDLESRIQSWNTPTPASKAPVISKQQKQMAAVGPTSKWARIAQVGVGKLNLINAYKVAIEHQSGNQLVKSNNSQGGRAALGLAKSGVKTVENVGKNIASAPIGLAKDVNKEIVQPAIKQAKQVPGLIEHPSKAVAIAKQNDQQAQAFNQAAKANKISQGTAKFAQALNAKQDVANLVSKGQSDKQIQKYLFNKLSSQNATAKRIFAEAGGTALLFEGGGGLKAVTTGAKAFVKTTAKNSVISGLINVASTIQQKPNAGEKEIRSSFEQGAGTGALLSVAGKVAGKTASKLKVATGRNKEVNQTITNAKTNALITKAQGKAIPVSGESKSSTVLVKNKGAVKLLGTGGKQAEGKGFTMSSKINSQSVATSQEITRLQNRVTRFQQGKLQISPNQAKVEAKQLADLKSGKVTVPTAKEKLTGTAPKSQSQAETVNPRAGEVSTSASVSRPKTSGSSKPGTPFEQALTPTKSENTAPVRELPGILGKFQNKFSGLINPRNDAAKTGNKDLVNVIDEHFANQNKLMEKSGQLHTSIKKAMKDENVSHADVAKDVETGTLRTKAGQIIKQHLDEAYKAGQYAGTAKGFVEKYYPRAAKFDESKGGFIRNKNSLNKSFKYNNERQTIEQVDKNGNVVSEQKYKTDAAFKKAIKDMGGKTEDRSHVLIPHVYATELNAANNAQTISKLERTDMVGGGKAIINDPGHDVKGYQRGIIPGKAVHTDAIPLLKTVVHTGSQNDLFNGVSRVNSFGKRMVTFNVVVHGKNFFMGNLRNTGMVNAVTNLVRRSVNDPQLIEQARKDGVNFFSAHSETPFQDNKTASLFRRNGLISKIRSANDQVLFHGYGNKVAIGVYKHVLDHPPRGLSNTEVRKLAAGLANETIMNMRPHEQSVAVKETGRLVLFATKFLTSTIRVGTRPFGIGLDKSLSKAAQHAQQRAAIKNLARGFGWSFAAAQAINYRATGHFTWQNNGSKLSPVFYIDKKTGKEYHISNFYGQVGDIIKMATNPATEFINKLSPGLQESSKQIANYDQYKSSKIVPQSDTGVKAIVDRMTHAAENLITPAGFSLSNTQQSTPGAVNAVKFFGFGASTVNNTPMENDILNRYYATLPSGASKTPPATTVLEQAARNDLAHGKTNTSNINQLKSQLTPTAFKTFMKTGAMSPAQRAFDKLTPDNKMQILQKYSPQQLKELNLKSFMTDLAYKKATYQALQNKGYTDQQINDVIQKTGYHGQLDALKAEAKRQASITAKASAHHPKYVSKFH